MKVFGIGLSKTGTSSLAYALEFLGYNVKDCLGVTKYTKGDLTSIDQDALSNYTALTDTPIPSFYQELDRKYPAAKFILTIRNMEGWLKSCKKQFNQKSADKQSEAHKQLFLDLYDTTVFDEDKFKQHYLNFIDGVKTYFKDRPHDLLILDVIGGEGWEKLCPFLGKPMPEIPFPKTNVTSIRWLNIHELAQNVRLSARPMHKLSQQLTANEVNHIDKLKNSLAAIFGQETGKRIEKTATKTQNLIEKELLRLSVSIPIISSAHHNTPLETRRSWNHFWLLSSSEGSPELKNGGVGYTINLALIEDGLPFLGIVYVPALDRLYYAALDKSVYSVQGGNKPIKIESLPAGPLDKNTKSSAITSISSSQGIGYLLCQSITHHTSDQFIIDDSKEWQTAAGHAILKTLGLTILDKTSDTELKYNKTGWNNASLTIDLL